MNPMDPRPMIIPIPLAPLHLKEVGEGLPVAEFQRRTETPKEIIQRMLQGGRYTNTFAVERERIAEYPKDYIEGLIEYKKRDACLALGELIGKKADFFEANDYDRWARVFSTSIYAFNLDEVRNIFSLVRQLKTDDEMFELMVAVEEVRNK